MSSLDVTPIKQDHNKAGLSSFQVRLFQVPNHRVVPAYHRSRLTTPHGPSHAGFPSDHQPCTAAPSHDHSDLPQTGLRS